MKQMLLTILLAVLIFTGIAGAACPSADITGDCKVNLEDFAIMVSEWLIDESSSFVTTLGHEPWGRRDGYPGSGWHCGRYYRLGG